MTPAERNAVLEEAADIAEGMDLPRRNDAAFVGGFQLACNAIASAIRSLKTPEPPGETDGWRTMDSAPKLEAAARAVVEWWLMDGSVGTCDEVLKGLAAALPPPKGGYSAPVILCSTCGKVMEDPAAYGAHCQEFPDHFLPSPPRLVTP